MLDLDDLDALPRLGWVSPSPCTPEPQTARRLGLASLHIKRDDQLEQLHGGTKTRKLDHLLATQPWRDAPSWVSMGAIGSGHLVALTEAARQLDRHLFAHLFWEPPSPSILDNLAFVASGPTTLRFTVARTRLGLRNPELLLSSVTADGVVIPPGATGPEGLVAMARAGLELAEQVRSGALPEPDVLVCPWGTGGTAAGLAEGLRLAGLSTRVVGVSAVEWALSHPARVQSVLRQASRALERAGISTPKGREPAGVEVVRSQLGAGYADPTPASQLAVHELSALGLAADSVYSGKAWAWLAASAAELRGKHVVFWFTPHRGHLPREWDWFDRLPENLRRRLRRPERPGPTRRRLLLGLASVGAVAALGVRVTGYDRMTDWSGVVLARWEAEAVAAVAEALLPPASSGPGPTPEQVAANVDAFLRGMPAATLREVHAMFVLLEHGTPLGLSLRRVTRLPVEARLAFLDRLQSYGGLLAIARRSIRDLCLLGYWQDPRTWSSIGYGGPRLPRQHRPRYDELLAPPNALPAGVVS